MALRGCGDRFIAGLVGENGVADILHFRQFVGADFAGLKEAIVFVAEFFESGHIVRVWMLMLRIKCSSVGSLPPFSDSRINSWLCRNRFISAC